MRKKSQLITIVTNSVLETGFHWKFVSTGWENENIFHFHWTVSLRSSIPGRLESSHTLIFLPKVVRKSREVKSASWFSWVSQREREREDDSSQQVTGLNLHEWQCHYDIRSAFPWRQRNMLMLRITSCAHTESVCTLCSCWIGLALDLSETSINRRPGNQTHKPSKQTKRVYSSAHIPVP